MDKQISITEYQFTLNIIGTVIHQTLIRCSMQSRR